MNTPQRIYLDNAATSWPKPDVVYEAVEHYQRHVGAPAGRSAYREASEVERQIRDTRKRIAQLVNAENAGQIIFTNNGTDSLNLAIHGSLRPGDHVVTTVVEHNSVLRPLRQLEVERGVQVTRVSCDDQGVVDPQDIRSALQDNTRLVALIHASNVTGALQPIGEVGRLAKEHGALYLVDAAQSLGHTPIDVQECGIDLLAAPGHKGLLGPLGTGVLYMAPRVTGDVQPIRQGGTGTQSESDRQPDTMPDRFETGNHNVPGILGLRAGVAFVAERGVDQIRDHEMRLTAQLVDGLGSIEGVHILGPQAMDHRVGVVSITVAGYDPQEFATMLDAAQSIQVRSGLHCAPKVHEALGTYQLGGAIRFSLGPFNTSQDIELAIAAVDELVTP